MVRPPWIVSATDVRRGDHLVNNPCKGRRINKHPGSKVARRHAVDGLQRPQNPVLFN
jgi:hypothetical protein